LNACFRGVQRGRARHWQDLQDPQGLLDLPDHQGGGGGGGPPLPPNAPAPAYGTMIPSIKAELKPDQLPLWDGNHNTAVNYFWKIQQLASLGGYVPAALGYWLWNNLVEGSLVQEWFVSLTHKEQGRMRQHYLTYLRGIQDNYLGDTWQWDMNTLYESQYFRQLGFERESPPAFITRHVKYTWMLVNVDNGGPLEVYHILKQAPVSWGPIIVLDNI
jgi:hypothetical protein